MRAPPEPDQAGYQGNLAGIASRHPAAGLAIGVVRDGRLSSFYGHGLADVAAGTPVSRDTVFRIGSITKTFTAIAVMQLAEQGLVDLDRPVGSYLRSYVLVPATPEHQLPTVRQLLTHSAGLPQLVHPARAFRPVLGETVPYGQRVPALAEFYRGRLHLIAEPGTRHTYSNHGFATLGQIVEDTTRQPLSRYLREYIFGPLGMSRTDLARSARVSAGLATGYALRGNGPRPVRDRDLVTAGAGAIYSTTADMASYVAALLAGGCGAHGRILKAETLACMFAPQYQPDPRLPGVGLGFFRRDIGGHLVVGHDGLLPGFTSQLSLAPADGIGVVAFTNGARGAMAWLGHEVGAIIGRILGAPDLMIRAEVPQHPEIWADICGWYSFRGSIRDVQKWFVAGAEVFVRRGQLILRPVTPVPALARGLPLHPDDPDDPYVFRIDLTKLAAGACRAVFSRAGQGRGAALHLDLDVGPLTFDKRSVTQDPRQWVNGALGVAAAAAAVSAARRHRRYAPLRDRGRAIAAAAATSAGGHHPSHARLA
jgi:CubicO group peptidase (beta-lactamase class C family)